MHITQDMAPFIYLFETVSGKYFYDVNKNTVVEVDEILYNFLYDWCYLSTSPVVNNDVLYSIELLKSKGFLSTNTATTIEHPLTKWYKEYLNSNLKRITLQVTQNCNMRCQYCSFSGEGILSRMHNSKKMCLDIAIKAIDFFKKHSAASKEVDISFYGGEPLLAFDLIKRIVDYVNKVLSYQKVTFSLTTNGTLLNEEICAFLEKHAFVVTVSIDGPQAYHDSNRRMMIDGSGSFARIYRNLNLLKDKYPNYYKSIQFNAVIEPDRNINEIESFFANDDLFANNIVVINRVNEALSTQQYGETLDYKSQKEMILFKALLQKRISQKSQFVSHDLQILDKLRAIMSPKEKLPPKIHHQGPCLPGYDRLLVDVKGDFRICEKVSEFSKHMIIGNVYSGFEYEKINKLLNIGDLTKQNCLSCYAINHCTICPATIDNITELSKELKLKQCEYQKKVFLENMQNYVIFKKIGIL